MKLLDHFYPPLSNECEWPSVHGTWVTTILQRLNGAVLSDRFAARSQVHVGTQVEIDVAAEEKQANGSDPANGHGGHDSMSADGGVATRTRLYTPPEPALAEVVAIADADLFEVQVFKQEGGWRLVAAIELVSPANKDRPSSRRAFARKCGSYLQRGVSVVVVDVVTERQANLHSGLIEVLHLPDEFEWSTPTGLSVVAYRTVRVKEQVRLDVWPHALSVGAELPTVPLWLAADLAVPLELDLTYAAACKSLRLA
jgi:hypothetical protein